jgi:hypothetical protein
MEFWEGAILVVGGVWLVSYMANRQTSSTAQVYKTASTGSVGTTNASNLTNITNQAGQTTVWGEPLEPPAPSIANPTMPARILPSVGPQPIYKPITSIAPRSGAIIQMPSRPISIARPINVML